MKAKGKLLLLAGMVAVAAMLMSGLSISGLLHPQAVWSQSEPEEVQPQEAPEGAVDPAANTPGVWAVNATTCTVDEAQFAKAAHYYDALGFKSGKVGTVEAYCAVENLPLQHPYDVQAFEVSYWDGDGTGNVCRVFAQVLAATNPGVVYILTDFDSNAFAGTGRQTHYRTYYGNYDFNLASYYIDVVVKRTNAAVPCSIGNVRLTGVLQ